MTNSLVIGTRGSALALWQANHVADALRAADPALDVEIRIVHTQGDRNLATPLAQIDDKGLFTHELEMALLAGDVDLCVHSMKDVPSELAPGCEIAATLPRADARDALVLGPRIDGARNLLEVADGSRLGTGSLRRTAQLMARFPQIRPIQIRGNVDTRLAKARGDEYDGAILACAGLDRLGLSDAIAHRIDPQEMTPAVGQGAVGVEIRSDSAAARRACELIDHIPTHQAVDAERLVLTRLEGGCKVPMGAFVRTDGDLLVIDTFVATLDGTREARVHLEKPVATTTALDLASEALEGLIAQGALDIRASITTDPLRNQGGDR